LIQSPTTAPVALVTTTLVWPILVAVVNVVVARSWHKYKLKMTGDDFKGIKNLKENLAKLKSMQAKVGVFGGRHPGSGESIPDIAMLHEFGSQTARSFSYKGSIIKIKGIPTRSFLRMPLRVKKLKVVGDKEYMKKYVMYALQTGHVNVPLEIMGHQAEAVIQDAFDWFWTMG